MVTLCPGFRAFVTAELSWLLTYTTSQYIMTERAHACHVVNTINPIISWWCLGLCKLPVTYLQMSDQPNTSCRTCMSTQLTQFRSAVQSATCWQCMHVGMRHTIINPVFSDVTITLKKTVGKCRSLTVFRLTCSSRRSNINVI